jgi:hypothetical protein
MAQKAARPSHLPPTPLDIPLWLSFLFGTARRTLQGMPIPVVVLLFVLILACLFILIRYEYRRMVRSRESRMFDQLYNSRF